MKTPFAYRLLGRFGREKAGTVAVMVGLAMPIFIGGLGLGGEVSYWYFNQRKVQNSADVGAYAGAILLRSGGDISAIKQAALAAAVKSGYDTEIGTMTLHVPATSGAFTGVKNTVEVKLREDLPRMLSSVFLGGAMPISGRAVARLEQGASACILALDPVASGAVTFIGSGKATLENCNVHANSVAADAVLVSGTATVSTPCVSAVGNVSATAGLSMGTCTNPIAHADPIQDPYAGLAEPALTGACAAKNTFDGPTTATYTIDPGRYCNGLYLKRTITMNPGVYVIDGGSLKIESSAVVRGTGVTIFLTNGANIEIAGYADVDLSATTSGTYAGILIFVDPDNGYETQIVRGDSGTVFEGVIYAPNSHIEYAGSSTTGGGCTQIVARTIEITGTAGLGSDCSAAGAKDIYTHQIVTIVE